MKYSLYNQLLRLYPKSYYERFGDEILQTTADILEATSSDKERQIMWIRILSDTSINIGYQQLREIGGIMSMNSNKRIITSLLWIAVGVAAILVYPALRGIGMEWMDMAGFLRLVYLSLFCIVLIGGSFAMAILSLFSIPRNLYKKIAK